MIKRGTRHHHLLRVPKEFEDISFSETAHWTAGDVSPDFDKVREENRVVSGEKHVAALASSCHRSLDLVDSHDSDRPTGTTSRSLSS